MQSLPNLAPSVAREVFATLCGSLPPPVTDTAENRAARDQTAMSAVAALHPSDAFEALLAAQIIAADAHAKDSLRLAVAPGQNAEAARQCRAQASAMMRQMQGGLRALQRTQAMREKAEAAMNPAAMERAGYWFRDISVPAAPPVPTAPPEPPELTEIERYVAVYPDRAARIRAAGGLPARLDFGPPDADIVDAIVNGTSPMFLALDRPPRAAVAA
jgi:hypothetical protein